MTPYRFSFSRLAAASFLILATRLFAGPAITSPTDADPAFQRGAFDLQTLAGLEYSVQNTGPLRPNFDYEVTVVRLGYMLDSPHRAGSFLRGNDEILLEGIGGAIFQGPGTALGGLSVLYRRNFLAPGARVVPYLTGGAGGVYSDAYHDHVQRALGSPFEFDLQANFGVRFRISEHISIDGELAYRHMSNADLARRNFGVNAIGGVFGASYAF